MKFKLSESFTRKLEDLKFIFEKASPTIMIIGGVAGLVTAGVLACKATRKYDEKMKLDEAKKEVDRIHELTEVKKLVDEGKNDEVANVDKNIVKEAMVYSSTDRARDLCKVYSKVVGNFIKLYGPSIALGAASSAFIFKGDKEHNKRYASMAGAYAALKASYVKLQERVKKEDKEGIIFNEEKVKVKETVIEPETKKKKVVTNTLEVIDPRDLPYDAYIFDKPYTDRYEDNQDYNYTFLWGIECTLNQILSSRKYVFKNEVLRMLGFDETEDGQDIGWALDGHGSGYISFMGDYDGSNKAQKRPDFIEKYIVNEEGVREKKIILVFNTDAEPLKPKLNKIIRSRKMNKENSYA